jgi:uncharacterized protein (TIGR03437 family)
VKVNGKAGSISYIGPTQINVLAPADDTVGPVQVTVTTQDGTSAPFTVQLKKPAPGFFLFDPQQRKYGAALIARSDGGVDYSCPEGLFGAGRPVKPGEILLLWGTGFGATDPAVPFGVVFSGAAPLTDTVTITIGGVSADVQFAGMTGAGLYQFNVVVPPLADGDQKVTAAIDGVTAQDNVLRVREELTRSRRLCVTQRRPQRHGDGPRHF